MIEIGDIRKAHAIIENQQRKLTQYRYLYNESLIEANGIAILCMEKALPKQPIKLSKNDDRAICPVCHAYIGFTNYCANCGQKINNDIIEEKNTHA